MDSYLKNINQKIKKMIDDIKKDEATFLKSIDESEKKKLQYITLYYRTVLGGCISFSEDIMSFADKSSFINVDGGGKDTNSPVLGSVSIGVENVNDDFQFSRDDFLKKYNRKRENNDANDNDIVLEDNPDIDMEVAEVYDDNDIVLEDNPDIDMEVEEVYDDNDIVLEDNPNIDMEVAEVYDDNDIVLEDNPDIDVEVTEIYNDILSEDKGEK